MRSTMAALALALTLLLPTGVGAQTPPSIMVADDTTTNAPVWTPNITATVEEFTAVRPASTPRLVDVAERVRDALADLSDAIVGLSIDLPDPSIDLPDLSSDLPDLGIDLPDLGIDDEVHRILNIPDLGIDLPGVDIGLPGGGGGQPGAEPDRGRPAVEPAATPPPAIAPTGTPPPARGTAVPPASPRAGCDPAYPEARTCLPPGPPFNQGCAMTPERNFIVLPPDPQGLDHDGDGIGCEPYTPWASSS